MRFKEKKSNSKEKHNEKETLTKLFTAKSILFVFVKIQNNIAIIKTNNINIINIKNDTPKVPPYNLKTLKFSPAKFILLQFVSLNIKMLANQFLIQKTDLRNKGKKEGFLLPNG